MDEAKRERAICNDIIYHSPEKKLARVSLFGAFSDFLIFTVKVLEKFVLIFGKDKSISEPRI